MANFGPLFKRLSEDRLSFDLSADIGIQMQNMNDTQRDEYMKKMVMIMDQYPTEAEIRKAAMAAGLL